MWTDRGTTWCWRTSRLLSCTPCPATPSPRRCQSGYSSTSSAYLRTTTSGLPQKSLLNCKFNEKKGGLFNSRLSKGHVWLLLHFQSGYTGTNLNVYWAELLTAGLSGWGSKCSSLWDRNTNYIPCKGAPGCLGPWSTWRLISGSRLRAPRWV